MIYIVIYYTGWLLSLLPRVLMYGLSAILSFLVFHLGLYRKKLVICNLKNAFPEKPDQEIRKMAKGFYRHFADQVMESFRMMHMSEKQILRHVHYENPELLEALFNDGRSVLLTTAHFGNWEWMVSLPLVCDHKVLVVYKPPANKDAHWVYTRFGSKYGGFPVAIRDYPRTLLKYRSEACLTATLILNDQRPARRNIRHWNTFLHQDTPWQNDVERLAVKLDLAVVFIMLEMKKRGKYHLSFHTLSDNPAETEENEITEAYSRILEKTILSKPELWLWSHRRWKHGRTSDQDYS